jgi:hypothetical protein
VDTRMYIMAHKKFQVPDKNGYIPLQVGSTLNEDLGYQKDDTGIQISAKNKTYCELTGMYWIWKNIQCDNVGICHYRRYFVQDELLTIEYMEECLKTYDIIVPDSGMTMYENVYKHYENRHKIKDLNICGEVLLQKYPKDYAAFKWSLERNFMSLGNMVITSKTLYDEYCSWLFDILFEVEKRTNIENYDDYQKRVFGFLSERLFRTWLLNRPLKVREERVLFINE